MVGHYAFRPCSTRQLPVLHHTKQDDSSCVDVMQTSHKTGIDKIYCFASTLRIGAATTTAACLITASSALFIPTNCAWGVSGGGLDYAGTDVSGKSFANANYKGKDFTQVIAKGTTFANSNLQGCRFYKAYLVNTDFSGADIRGASLEDTSMDGATLDNALAAGAYFSKSLLDVKSMKGADFTDAQLPPKLLPRICEREGFATGTNPKTGADTRDSLMCP